MLSIAECKRILHEGGLPVSDSEVKEIRDFLYKVAELDFQLLNMTTNAESDNIHKGFN
jgi:hypothetical protein